MTAPRVDRPEPGVYAFRRHNPGPLIPVRIWHQIGARDEEGRLIEDDGLKALVINRPANPYHIWPWVAGREIDPTQYANLLARIDHASRHEPWSPYAPENVWKTLDLDNLTL